MGFVVLAASFGGGRIWTAGITTAITFGTVTVFLTGGRADVYGRVR